MNQLGSILRLRRRLAKNRLAQLSPRRQWSILVLLGAGIVALLVGGHLASPTLLEPPIDLATPRGLGADELPTGAAALEAAFWLSALLASVLNFRVLELLFRRPDIVALQILPIEPAALFVDRAMASFTESAVAAAGASIFFIPLFWHGASSAALASMAMLFGGLLFGAAISLAVMLLATQQLVPEHRDDGQKRPSFTDSYGGSGQILLYAPALALAGVVVLALFWKLLIGEPLRLGNFSEPFWIGTATIAAIVVGCLVLSYRTFVRDYYAMAPRFHEADAADFSAFIDYQESSFDDKNRWEWALPKPAGKALRALILDDDRRVAGARVGYLVVMLLAVVGLMVVDLDALPLWAAAMVPATLAATVVNPWYRLAQGVERLDTPMALPVSTAHRRLAALRAAMREFLFIAVPYALAAALILGYFRGLEIVGLLIASVALASGLAIAGAVSLTRQYSAPTGVLRWLPSVVIVAMTAAAIFSLWAALFAGIGLFVAAFALSRLTGNRHD